MRVPQWVLGFLLPYLAVAQFQPILNLWDKRFLNYQKPGPTDSRSPCPGLNALANHGFLPRNGRNVNALDIILGLFLGLGVSPETSGIVIAFGLVSSHNPLSLSLDLEDLRNHHFVIEHDCSFARNDALIGDNLNFNPKLWAIALKEMNKTSVVNPFNFGRGKAARVQDQRRRNPRTVYGPRAWFNGFSEVGLVLSTLGTVPGLAKLEYVRSLVEEERLPYHLGWRPRPFFCNLATMLGVGAASVLGDNYLLQTVASVVLSTPSEILQVFIPPNLDFLPELENMILSLGFDNGPMKKLSKALHAVSKHKKIVHRSTGTMQSVALQDLIAALGGDNDLQGSFAGTLESGLENQEQAIKAD
ncbi:peroxidase, family 2 domain-containing protein [Hirsutella rhossiliensis]|uniref:Peroxidase, family 2 domain-containing protein n=1 Tax=Hirsutella rhossiliensis TaxID=111463 RepID=A0A9P8MQA4_9HYPO|nr:peroxidase, family 2 domain-containing protein [Hirsutella rhossiliensis]KAH0959199.1 peroxidase, family 2 domain-containing protein [Hirsutella rhossiliensis]